MRNIVFALLLASKAFSLPFTNSAIPTVNGSDSVENGANSGFWVSLGYDGLIAWVNYRVLLPAYGCNPNTMWSHMANKIEDDSNSPPYARGFSTSRYDIWPKLTLGPLPTWEVLEPSYLVRFSIIQDPLNPIKKPIDRKLLQACSHIFRYMANLPQRPHFAFVGSIGVAGSAAHFQFRLYATGPAPAFKERQRAISSTDLEMINQGRRTILAQTTRKDIIVFVGSSGSYFYYAMNRPQDARADRRNAFLLPVSGASSWSIHTPLDVIWNLPEFQTYFNNEIRPIIQPGPTVHPSSARLILVDYTRTGSSLVALGAVFTLTGLWNKAIFWINIESPLDPHGQPAVPTLGRLEPIQINSWEETRILVEGGLGRVVPPYPYLYWDVPPELVEFPEKEKAAEIIKYIREGWVPKEFDSENSTGALSGGRYEMPGEDSDSEGYNNNPSSIPAWPTSESSCWVHLTDTSANTTRCHGNASSDFLREPTSIAQIQIE